MVSILNKNASKWKNSQGCRNSEPHRQMKAFSAFSAKLKHIYGPTVLGTIVPLKSGNPAVT